MLRLYILYNSIYIFEHSSGTYLLKWCPVNSQLGRKKNVDISIIRIFFCIIYMNIILVLKNHIVKVMKEMLMQYFTPISFQDLCSFIVYIFFSFLYCNIFLDRLFTFLSVRHAWNLNLPFSYTLIYIYFRFYLFSIIWMNVAGLHG